ncbi:MAG: formylglycine-generating enzyme family protein [Snowella sp.]|nr:formylglycine-generating enzyme family protein [Snowella sp.]
MHIAFLKEVSSYVAENLGKSVDQFWALIRSPKSGIASEETAFLSAFATVTAQILRGLGPEFAEIADRLTLPQNNPAPELEPEFAGIPPLEDFSFEVPTIVFEEEDEWPAIEMQTVEVATITLDDPFILKPFSFRIATLEKSGVWEVTYREGEAQRFIEQLDQVELEMVAIPSGTFMMGSPAQHQVKISEFFMGRYPITQAQWRAVAAMDKEEITLEADPSNCKGDDHPVERVNWHEAVEFCRRLSRKTGRNYRLPSEAEWEYGCRAGTKTAFHFGEGITTDLANYNGRARYETDYNGEYRAQTTSVDQFKIANNFGLCDLHGNICEWCIDPWHDNYKGTPTDDSVWEGGEDNSTRVLRGGSWFDFPRDCRSFSRNYDTSTSRFNSVGFRVVCAVRGSV